MLPHVSCLSFLVNVVPLADVPVPVADLSPYDTVREPKTFCSTTAKRFIVSLIGAAPFEVAPS